MHCTGSSGAEQEAGAANPRTGTTEDKWRPGAPDWIVRGGPSSRSRPPDWSIRKPAAVDAPRNGTSGAEQAAGATGSHRSGHEDEAVEMQRSRVEDEAGEKQRKQDEDKAKVTQRCTHVDKDEGMRWSSCGDEAEEKHRSSDEEEPEEMQSRGDQDEAVHKQPRADKDKECRGLDHPGHNKKERPSETTTKGGGRRHDAPDWNIRGGTSSRGRHPPDWNN